MKRILLLGIFVLSVSLSYSKTWSADASISSSLKVTGNSSVANNVVVTIKAGTTLEIVGDFTLNGVLILEEGAVLKVSGMMNVDGRYGKSGYKKLNSKGAINVGGDFKTGNVNYNGPVEIVLADMTVGGDVQIRTNTTVQIPSEKRVFFQGDFLNQGFVNVNGRLVVGTLENDSPNVKTIVTSNGTITNYGTFNIKTTTSDYDKSEMDKEAKRAAVTCKDFENYASSSAAINMEKSFLIVQNDLTLGGSSTLNFSGNVDTAYVDVWHDFIQDGRGYSGSITYDSKVNVNDNAKVLIAVGNTYKDNTKIDNKKETHPWGFKDGTDAFFIDDRVFLSLSYYDYEGTTYTAKYHENNIQFLSGQIDELNNVINRIENDLKSWEVGGDMYNATIDLYDNLGVALSYIDDEVEQLEMEKKLREHQKIYAEKLKENITEYPNNSNKWKEFWKQWYKDESTFWEEVGGFFGGIGGGGIGAAIGSAIGSIFDELLYRQKSIVEMILDYIKNYGINAAEYDKYTNNISVMLPIELSYFEVSQENTSVVFEWATETETNNDFFTVEYSVDGVRYNSISTVNGAGTSTEKLWYSTKSDADMFNGIVYFRLKQTDFNGESTYSEVRAINIQGEEGNFVVYPNLATTDITITGGMYSNVYFVDMQSKTYPAELVGENQYSVENLPSGMNFVVIVTAKGTVVKEILVVR